MGQVLGGDLGERFRVWGGICCMGGYTVDGRNVIGGWFWLRIFDG